LKWQNELIVNEIINIRVRNLCTNLNWSTRVKVKSWNHDLETFDRAHQTGKFSSNFGVTSHLLNNAPVMLRNAAIHHARSLRHNFFITKNSDAWYVLTIQLNKNKNKGHRYMNGVIGIPINVARRGKQVDFNLI